MNAPTKIRRTRWQAKRAKAYSKDRERWVAVRFLGDYKPGVPGGERQKEWLKPDGTISAKRVTYASQADAEDAIGKFRNIRRHLDWMKPVKADEAQKLGGPL